MRWFKNKRSPRHNRVGSRYVRATAVVFNSDNEVLLVKHNRQNEWALPGGMVNAAEDPMMRAVVEVAEETGLQVANATHVGRYAGNVASHEVFIAQADRVEPRPNPQEIQDAMWWDGRRPIRTQAHVDAILAIARNAAPRTE